MSHAGYPWTSIADTDITLTSNSGSSVITLTLLLAQGYEPPAFSGDRRVKYKKKKHQIVMTVLGVKGISAADFGGLFITYWRAGMARAELQKFRGQLANA